MGAEPPRDIPDPLIFGPGFPDLRLVMEQYGEQVAESRSNCNLRLSPSGFEGGTYTMAQFLIDLHFPRRARGCDVPNRDCDAVHEACHGLCPLVLDSQEAWEDEHGAHIEYDFHPHPETEACPVIGWLAEMGRAESQRRFFHQWCRRLCTNADEAWDADTRNLTEVNWRARTARLGFPALIPEVWLNYVGPPKTAEDRTHLEYNPSRVDFVMFAGGRKAVIEIDGPSHYADYDEANRRYTVSEERYTKNLRIDRSLQEQGWDIYRFSRWEVMNTPDDEYDRLLSHLPWVFEHFYVF